MAVAIPLDPPELLASISSQGRSESITIPCDPAFLDQEITSDDLRSVHQCLSHISVKWYTIGLYLRLPKEKLDEIQLDCPDTSRRLIEMIDTWISSGVPCSWRRLFLALCDCGQTETARLAITKASEIVLDLKEPQEKLPGHFWEAKQKARLEQETTFQLLQILANNSRDACIMSLRDYLVVPNAINNESMLKNIELYLPIKLFCSDNFLFFARATTNMTKLFQQNQKCLEVWANLLMTDMNMVCDKLLKLAKQKENLKEQLFKSEAQKMTYTHTIETKYHYAPQNDMENNVLARDIIQDIEGAGSYKESLCHGLSICLDHVQSTVKQTDQLVSAMTSTKKAYKGVAFTSGVVTTMLGVILFITFPILLTSIMTVVVTAGVGWIAACLAYRCVFCPGAKSILKQALRKLYIVTLVGIHKKIVLCLLAETALIISVTLLATSPAKTEMLMQHISVQIQNVPKVHKHINEVHLVSKVRSFVVGIILGCLGIIIFSSLFHRIQKYFGIIAFLFFILIILFWKSLATNHSLALIGTVVGVFISLSIMDNRDTLAHSIASCLAMIFWVIMFLGGFIIGMLIGLFVFGQKSTITAAAVGALGIVCSLLVTSYKRFPYFIVDSKMDESIRPLNESIHKLQNIRENIQRLIT